MRVLLQENPRRRKNLLYDYYGDPFANPRGRKRGRPRKKKAGLFAVGGGQVGKLAQGVDIMDVVGASVGLAAAYMIPPLIVKDTTTTVQKMMRIGVAVAAALGAGYVVRAVAPAAGKAAVLGGLAGAGVQTIEVIRGKGIVTGRRMLGPGIGDSMLVSPGLTRSEEAVSLIQP